MIAARVSKEGSHAFFPANRNFIQMGRIRPEAIFEALAVKLEGATFIQNFDIRRGYLTVEGETGFVWKFAFGTGENIKITSVLFDQRGNAVIWGAMACFHDNRILYRVTIQHSR